MSDITDELQKLAEKYGKVLARLNKDEFDVWWEMYNNKDWDITHKMLVDNMTTEEKVAEGDDLLAAQIQLNIENAFSIDAQWKLLEEIGKILLKAGIAVI